jgi:hypothetical protein
MYELSGMSELSTVNRAIGVLIGHGQHPDQAADTLRRGALRDGLEPTVYAARLLERGRADRDTNSRRQVGDALQQRGRRGTPTISSAVAPGLASQYAHSSLLPPRTPWSTRGKTNPFQAQESDRSSLSAIATPPRLRRSLESLSDHARLR